MPGKKKEHTTTTTMAHRQHHHDLKIVVLGAGGVGKSALTVQYVQGVFIEKYDPTIEDSYKKTVNLNIQPRYMATEDDHAGAAEDPDNTSTHHHHSFRLEILDTAGTEQFTAMRDLYYKSGDAFVLVYSITSTPTLHELVGIRDQLLRIKNAARVPMVLVGNKVDLSEASASSSLSINGSSHHQRVVSVEQGRELAAKWGVPFVETSARRNYNIDRAFTLLLEDYVHGREERAMRQKKGSAGEGKKMKKKCLIF